MIYCFLAGPGKIYSAYAKQARKFGIKFWMAIDSISSQQQILLSWKGLDEKWRCQLAKRCGDKVNESFIQARF